jgi:hypothetical protein
MVDSIAIATVILLASASALLLALMLYPATLLRWFQRKRYQYEVTFSLYMLTSTEKFIFSTSTLRFPAPIRPTTPPTSLQTHQETHTNLRLQIQYYFFSSPSS